MINHIVAMYSFINFFASKQNDIDHAIWCKIASVPTLVEMIGLPMTPIASPARSIRLFRPDLPASDSAPDSVVAVHFVTKCKCIKHVRCLR